MEYYGWDALNDDYNDNNDDVPIVLYENDTNDEEKPVLNCDDKCIIDFIVYPDNINAIVNDNVNDNMLMIILMLLLMIMLMIILMLLLMIILMLLLMIMLMKNLKENITKILTQLVYHRKKR
jgi:hypothetical protein